MSSGLFITTKVSLWTGWEVWESREERKGKSEKRREKGKWEMRKEDTKTGNLGSTRWCFMSLYSISPCVIISLELSITLHSTCRCSPSLQVPFQCQLEWSPELLVIIDARTSASPYRIANYPHIFDSRISVSILLALSQGERMVSSNFSMKLWIKLAIKSK